jgi:hypothetical protein
MEVEWMMLKSTANISNLCDSPEKGAILMRHKDRTMPISAFRVYNKVPMLHNSNDSGKLPSELTSHPKA